MNDFIPSPRVNHGMLFQRLRLRVLHNAITVLRERSSLRLILIGLLSWLIWALI